MPVPKKRSTRSARGSRRGHDALLKPLLTKCPNCGALTRPHRVCQACGFYRGAAVKSASK